MSEILTFLSACAERNPALHARISAALETVESALHIFHNADELCLSFNGGKDSTVVLHLLRAALARRGLSFATSGGAAHVCPSVVFFSTTGQELSGGEGSCGVGTFPEILAFMRSSEAAYGFSIRELKGFKDGLASLVGAGGGVRGVLMGTRTGDPDAVQLKGPFSPTSLSWPPAMRVCPILDWTYPQVWEFLTGTGLPYCPLYDLGYTSLGSPLDSVPNPHLRRQGGEEEGFLPAWQLKDGTLERAGRQKRPLGASGSSAGGSK